MALRHKEGPGHPQSLEALRHQVKVLGASPECVTLGTGGDCRDQDSPGQLREPRAAQFRTVIFPYKYLKVSSSKTRKAARAQWHRPVILTPGRLKHEDSKFKTSLGYRESSRPA